MVSLSLLVSQKVRMNKMRDGLCVNNIDKSLSLPKKTYIKVLKVQIILGRKYIGWQLYLYHECKCWQNPSISRFLGLSNGSFGPSNGFHHQMPTLSCCRDGNSEKKWPNSNGLSIVCCWSIACAFSPQLTCMSIFIKLQQFHDDWHSWYQQW